MYGSTETGFGQAAGIHGTMATGIAADPAVPGSGAPGTVPQEVIAGTGVTGDSILRHGYRSGPDIALAFSIFYAR